MRAITIPSALSPYGVREAPDLFPVYDTTLANDLIESGRVKEVTEDIAKYMPARLKEIYKQYPTTFNPVVRDGKVYGMAISPNLTEGQVMLIRQDWLDSLGLEAPTTIDEFESVIAAFTNEDPDGNGKNDTYGFTFSGKDGYNTGWVSDPVMIFSAYTGKKRRCSGAKRTASWRTDRSRTATRKRCLSA